MEDKRIGSIFREWILCRKEEPAASVKEFIFKKYMEFHRDDPGDREEREAAFRKLVQEWEKKEREFERYAERYPDSPELELWQGMEMLENVMIELEFDTIQRYQYVLNVRQLCYDKLLGLMDKESGGGLRAILEQAYEEEWERAEGGITDGEFQELFSETVSLMRYVGLAYDDETRKVLAEIGVGWRTEFKDGSMEAAEKDVCFLMDFLISEMVVSETDEEYTKEEQKAMTEQVIPVCVSSVSMVQAGESPEHAMKLAYSYLGGIFTGKNLKLLAKAAAVLIAAKALFFLFKLVILGSAAQIGLSNLWNECRKAQHLDKKEAFLKSFIEKKLLQNGQEKEIEIPGNFRPEKPEELIDEEVYEDA
ncbi:MAG: hypothetical protein NC341_09155 [Blautia sp.]|nr:hypothetical protein [Blautia sp.]MCM1201842.1 hypothetical protein [Bacteroides fragilis]